MAKGRKLTASRSELLLGSYGYGNGNGNGHETANGAAELGEDDVWQTVDEMVNGDENFVEDSGEWVSRAVTESNGGLGSYRSRRHVQRSEHHHHHRGQVGGLSLAFDGSGKTPSSRIVHQFRGQQQQQDGVAASPRGRHVAMSAPVNVPDWSKIYRVDSVESLHDSDDAVDDNDSEIVPPHEYLAREYARSRPITATNSVFEGVGRTLKGRDLSRVRDAVWSQTGFDG